MNGQVAIIGVYFLKLRAQITNNPKSSKKAYTETKLFAFILQQSWENQQSTKKKIREKWSEKKIVFWKFVALLPVFHSYWIPIENP